MPKHINDLMASRRALLGGLAGLPLLNLAACATLRWQGAAPPSNFPDGGDAWPRSAVVVITRDDGGRIGD